MNFSQVSASFEEALNKYGIPRPKQKLRENTYIRWGKNSQYYALLFQDGKGGIIGDWVAGYEDYWFVQSSGLLTELQKKQALQQIEDNRLSITETQKNAYEASAKIAHKKFIEFSCASKTHPYLVKKGIEAFDIRQFGQLLFIPLRDTEGKIWSYQTIDTDGKKFFMPKAKKKGMFHLIGHLEQHGFLLVCEGYATGASLYMATNIPVVIAFDAYNLDPVIDGLKQKYPLLKIILCGDDDMHRPMNTGRMMANKIKEKYEISLIFPNFDKIEKASLTATDFNDLHHLAGINMVRSQIEKATEQQEQIIPNVDFLKKSKNRPKFPVDLFPKKIQDMARQYSRNMNAPIDFFLCSLLPIIGIALGTRIQVVTKSRWKESPIIWLILNGNPSSGKTPALNAMYKVFSEIEENYSKKFKEEERTYKRKQKEAKLKQKIWEKRCKEAIEAGQDYAEPDFEEPIPPRAKRITLKNTTIEKVLELLIFNCCGLINIYDELSGFFGSMGQYKSGGSGNDRSIWLSAYNGDPYQYDRVRQDACDNNTITCLGVSIVGGTQPDMFSKAILSETNDGMSARFLISSPEPIPFGDAGEAVDDSFYNHAILGLVKQTRDNENQEDFKKEIPLSAGAEDRLAQYRRKMNETEKDYFGLMIGYQGKNSGKALRLSLIFEIMDKLFNSEMSIFSLEKITTVSEESMRKAIMLLEEYFTPMAQYSFNHMCRPQVIVNASKIANYILKEKRDIINTRELYRATILGSLYEKARIYDEAAEQLVSYGILEPIEHESSVRGGRKKKDYKVNPLLHQMIRLEEVI